MPTRSIVRLAAALSLLVTLCSTTPQPATAHGGGGGGGEPNAEPFFVGRRGISNPFVCGPNASSFYTRKNGSISILASTQPGSAAEAGVHVELRPDTHFIQLNFGIIGDYTGNKQPRVRWTFDDGSTFTGNAFITNIGPVRSDGFRIVSLYSASYGQAVLDKFNAIPVTDIDIFYTNDSVPRSGFFTSVLVNGLLAPPLTPTLTCPN